jgi:hypothetical protein
MSQVAERLLAPQEGFSSMELDWGSLFSEEDRALESKYVAQFIKLINKYKLCEHNLSD